MRHSSSSPHALTLTLLGVRMAICRLSPSDAIPVWAEGARTFLSITRTTTELSIVAAEALLPADLEAERGYYALRVEGPLPFEMVGVVASLASPLAAAGVPIFPLATYDTDYLLIGEGMLDRAIHALTSAGHTIVGHPQERS